ncbi:hypothetical protein LUZ63_005654 [Rhynchospora breviuscula]|uniref:DUF7806 domain-containing protein n=1 Tax=Rhynchospora breviuscula TaxID=2022672 RepID=A0A9Q0CNA9_9POAL|nr:hypothetical protein LUZ63_005654 [Rhynchospora breviuscula]
MTDQSDVLFESTIRSQFSIPPNLVFQISSPASQISSPTPQRHRVFPPQSRMEKFNADIQKKYHKIKKQKLRQLVDQNKDSEKKVFGLVSAAMDMVEHEGKRNDNLFEDLLFYREKLAETEKLELENKKRLSSEAPSLQNLLLQKNEATISIEMLKLQKNEATISIETTKEPPKADIIEEDNAFQNEIANQSVCRCISGDQVVRDSISDVLRTLIENVLGMRVTFGPQCAEVIHEKTGYAFSLTWSTDGEELVYRVSSLGTLANIALKWMKEEIMFNTKMCPLFFNRICGIIGRA